MASIPPNDWLLELQQVPTVSKCITKLTHENCLKVALEVSALGFNEPYVQSPVTVQHLDLSIDVSEIAIIDHQNNLLVWTKSAQKLLIKVVEGKLVITPKEFHTIAAAYKSCLLRTVRNVLGAFPGLFSLHIDACGKIPAHEDVRMALGQNNMFIFQCVQDYDSGSLSTFTVQTGTYLDEWSKKAILVPDGPKKKGRKQKMVDVLEWDIQDRKHLFDWVADGECDMSKWRDAVRKQMRAPASLLQEDLVTESKNEGDEAKFKGNRRDSVEVESG